LLSIVNKAAPSLTPEDGASTLLCDFVSKCLQKDPADRWSAEQLLSHPFMTSSSLPSSPLHPPWPVTESVDPDPVELDTIVEAVVGCYYQGVASQGIDNFLNGDEDQRRWDMLARQLGCEKATVEAAFLRRLSPTPTAMVYSPPSPSVSATISYLPQSALHSRRTSVTVQTMADCVSGDSRASSGRSISHTASALSHTLSSAQSMSQRIREQMRIDEERTRDGVDGYDDDDDGSPSGRQRGASSEARVQDEAKEAFTGIRRSPVEIGVRGQTT